jgi:hypothetical protein
MEGDVMGWTLSSPVSRFIRIRLNSESMIFSETGKAPDSSLATALQMTGNALLGVLGKVFGTAIALVFILACGLDQLAHAFELGGQVAAEAAHREVDPQTEVLAFGEFPVHLLAAQVERAAAAQTENFEDRAHDGLHHPVGEWRWRKMLAGFHGWIPFS